MCEGVKTVSIRRVEGIDAEELESRAREVAGRIARQVCCGGSVRVEVSGWVTEVVTVKWVGTDEELEAMDLAKEL